ILARWRPAGNQGLSTRLHVLLQEDDLMSAQAGDTGTFQARRPAADDDEFERPRRSRHLGPPTLAADEGILHASDSLARVDAIDAALVVAKARADIIELSGPRLVGQVRVGDQRPIHDAQV